MAVKLKFGVFEAMRVDFRVIFEVELDEYCRVSNVLDFDFLFLDIVEGYFEVEL